MVRKTPNYAFKPIAEQALRPNQIVVPQRLNAALYVNGGSVSSPVVYDKAKYHDESVAGFGLHEDQACVHTAFFFGWLVETDHVSDEFAEDSADEIVAYRAREITAVQLYKNWDRCLVDDMLNDEANEFAQHYFDFQDGAYLKDYNELLVKDLESEFHVPYTWENQAAMSERINERFAHWRAKSKRS